MITRNYLILFLLTCLSIACASSNDKTTAPEQYPNLVELTPAAGPGIQQTSIYIDSVKIIDREAVPSLLLVGNFPDGCTHIGHADHQFPGRYPSITITAWRDSGASCTQALVSFSYIYKQLPGEYLASIDSVRINQHLYPVDH